MTPCVITPLCCLLIRHIKPKHLSCDMTQREPEGSLAERLSLPGRLSAGNIDAIQRLFVLLVTIW